MEKNRNGRLSHPDVPHYGGAADDIQPIDLIDSQNLNFFRGNVVKYVCRAGKKDDELDDLTKARQFIDWEIERIVRDATKF